MEYHSIKLQIITRTKQNKNATKEIYHTFSLTEAINWLKNKKSKKDIQNAS